MAKVKKSRDDLYKKFNSGIQYIRHELKEIESIPYDDTMRFEIATAIATKLRVLLSDTAKNKSLLSLLNIKNRLLFPSQCIKHVDIASNMIFSAQLVGFKITNEAKLYCVPIVPDLSNKLSSTFNVWWNEIVIDTKGQDSSMVTRGEIIRTLSDNEGGAHEDPYHKDSYVKINLNSGFKVIDSDGNEKTLLNNYYVESLIVIAYEFLNAVNLYIKYIEKYVKDEEITKFNIIQISYIENRNEHPIIRNRYFPNTGRDLNKVFKMAFDYYRTAKYSIIPLRGFIYRDIQNRKYIKFLVIDSEPTEQLVYLRSDEIRKEALLLKRNKKYILINHDDDITKEIETHELEFYLNLLSKNKKNAFDNYLSKQIIL